MTGWDFSIFWLAGHAVLTGQDPYSIQYFYYPLPAAYIFAIFALLPIEISFGVWIGVNLAFLILIFKKDFWQWLLYTPLLHQFSSGQIELLLWFMERGIGRNWKGAILGALITLKPQAAVILLSWHLVNWIRYDRKTFFRWLLLTIILWGSPVLWSPNWILEWWNSTYGINVISVQNSPSLFSLLKLSESLLLPIILISIAVYFLGIFRNKEISRACATLASPVDLFYSTLALIDTAPPWVLVPVSLFSVILVLITKTFIPFILLSFAVLGWQVLGRKQPSTE